MLMAEWHPVQQIGREYAKTGEGSDYSRLFHVQTETCALPASHPMEMGTFGGREGQSERENWRNL